LVDTNSFVESPQAKKKWKESFFDAKKRRWWLSLTRKEKAMSMKDVFGTGEHLTHSSCFPSFHAFSLSFWAL
jgi:hypothetical protein